MIYLLICILSALAGSAITVLIFRFYSPRKQDVAGKPVKAIPKVPFEDLACLVRCFDADKIAELAEKMKLAESNPAFNDKYNRLLRRQRNNYFTELAGVMARFWGDELTSFMRRYPMFSSQDIALMLMCRASVANRTIMKLLSLNSESLKKRKLRLKAKMHSFGVDFSQITENDV